MQPLERLLQRIHQLSFVSFLLRGFLILAAAWLGWQIVQNISTKYLFDHPIASLLTLGALILFLFSKSVALYLSRTDQRIAAEIDQKYSLKDRMVTYVEYRKSEHPFKEALIHECASKAESISAFPIAAMHRGMAAPGMIMGIFLIVIIVLPFLPVPESVEIRKEQRRTIGRESKQLQNQLQRLLSEKKKDPELKKMIEELRNITRELDKPGMDRAEALKKLNAAQDKLNQQKAKLQKSNEQKLGDAWNEFRPGNQDFTDSDKQQLEKLAKEFEKSMGERRPDHGKEGPGGKESTAKKLEMLKKALSEYESQKEQAAKTMAELQKAIENTKQGIACKHPVTADSKISDRDVEKGRGGVEDGPGTTNKDIGPSHFDTKKQQKSEYVEDKTKAEYEKLYNGQRENTGKDPLYIDSQWNDQGDPTFSRIRSFGVKNEPKLNEVLEGSTLPNQTESEVRKEKIPPSYQKIVKEYFESIE